MIQYYFPNVPVQPFLIFGNQMPESLFLGRRIFQTVQYLLVIGHTWVDACNSDMKPVKKFNQAIWVFCVQSQCSEMKTLWLETATDHFFILFWNLILPSSAFGKPEYRIGIVWQLGELRFAVFHPNRSIIPSWPVSSWSFGYPSFCSE